MTTEIQNMRRDGDGTHWAGCEAEHWDCAISKLRRDLSEAVRERDDARLMLRWFDGNVHRGLGRGSDVETHFLFGAEIVAACPRDSKTGLPLLTPEARTALSETPEAP